MKNLYDILEVPKNCDNNQIKKSYYRLIRLWHPDKNKTEEAKNKTKEINEAYEILSDDIKRKKYDITGSINENHINNSDIFNSFSQDNIFNSFYQDNIKNNPFFNIIKMKYMKKKNINHTININISDLYNGYKNTIPIKRFNFNGSNINEDILNLNLDLKVGFNPNNNIIMKGYGNKVIDEIGSLIINFNINNNNDFTINSKTLNLYSKQKISLEQSLCGLNMSIKMPDDTILKYSYRNIINPNNLYEIKNVGVPIKQNNDYFYSNLFIQFIIQYPNILNDNIINDLKNIFNISHNKVLGSHNLLLYNNDSSDESCLNDDFNDDFNDDYNNISNDYVNDDLTDELNDMLNNNFKTKSTKMECNQQ